jgi:hypothetical protein
MIRGQLAMNIIYRLLYRIQGYSVKLYGGRLATKSQIDRWYGKIYIECAEANYKIHALNCNDDLIYGISL